MKLFNTIIIGVLFLIVCGMGYLVYDSHSIQNPKFTKQEQQTVALGFYQAYGNGNTVLTVQPIDKYYEVTWQDSKNEYMSIDLNGKWVVIASQALPITTTTTP
jgi:uncharacterized protein YpmB